MAVAARRARRRRGAIPTTRTSEAATHASARRPWSTSSASRVVPIVGELGVRCENDQLSDGFDDLRHGVDVRLQGLRKDRSQVDDGLSS